MLHHGASFEGRANFTCSFGGPSVLEQVEPAIEHQASDINLVRFQLNTEH
jgi:hypothetical protein